MIHLLIALTIVSAASARELALKPGDAAKVRALFSVCTASDQTCADGACALTVEQLSCERKSVPAPAGTCAFVCAGSPHQLTDDQALAVMSLLGKPKALYTREGDVERFTKMRLICAAGKTARCRFVHPSL